VFPKSPEPIINFHEQLLLELAPLLTEEKIARVKEGIAAAKNPAIQHSIEKALYRVVI
jgi:hypothetical protein